jgi:hypothetical protein
MRGAILTPEHPRFFEFSSRLYSAVYPNDRYNCWGDYRHTVNILRIHYPEIDIAGTLEYFHKLHGHCDCEVGLNVCAGEPLTGNQAQELFESMKARGE